MGQKLQLKIPPPKHLCFKLFQLLLLAVHFQFHSGITQLTKTVKDIAVLPCNYNISTEELTNVRVYWQKGHEVVQAVLPGKMQVSPKYKNRTIIDVTNSLSVVILALRLSDAGKYTCVIQKYDKGSFKVVHLTNVFLFIRADFPVPNITDLGTQSTNIKRIICSTSGGFPKPHLSWLENGKELNATKETVSQDPETELYNISSELHFNMANNHNFTCSIKYGDLTVSQIFNWKTCKSHSGEFLLPSFSFSIISMYSQKYIKMSLNRKDSSLIQQYFSLNISSFFHLQTTSCSPSFFNQV
ncbi:T-lymphocyte activation antigen CD80 [Saccopteryx bilineata]|uniref:T-lymphocyte activation antigen CD80 n=1 Tax=Saccopteryx bilineata TaxID=59482 RepID=UPI00338E906F